MKTYNRFGAVVLAAALLLSLTAGAMAESAGIEVELPQGYVEGSPLPLYRAQERTQTEANFFDKVPLEWFNTSGQAGYENWSKRARYDHFIFSDGAELNIDAANMEYRENDGTYMMINGDAPNEPEGPFARENFACAIADLGGSAYTYSYLYPNQKFPQDVKLEKTELSAITLEQATQRVQELLSKLGAEGYEVNYALDMSVEHIRTIGEWETARQNEYYNRRAEGGYWDYSKATEADEGYYLHLEKRMDGVPVGYPDGDLFTVSAFVDGTGVRSFRLYDGYVIGEVYETPERLLTSAEILECFNQGNARREKDGFMQPVATGAKLMYAPLRASNKKDGMALTPVWYITYDFLDGSKCEGWAWYSAVDGRLVMDCYS